MREKVRAKGPLPTALEGTYYREDYARQIAIVEHEEDKLWFAVKNTNPEDKSKGARMLKSNHSRAVQEILMGHRQWLQETIPDARQAHAPIEDLAQQPPAAHAWHCDCEECL